MGKSEGKSRTWMVTRSAGSSGPPPRPQAAQQQQSQRSLPLTPVTTSWLEVRHRAGGDVGMRFLARQNRSHRDFTAKTTLRGHTHARKHQSQTLHGAQSGQRAIRVRRRRTSGPRRYYPSPHRHTHIESRSLRRAQQRQHRGRSRQMRQERRTSCLVTVINGPPGHAGAAQRPAKARSQSQAPQSKGGTTRARSDGS